MHEASTNRNYYSAILGRSLLFMTLKRSCNTISKPELGDTRQSNQNAELPQSALEQGEHLRSVCKSLRTFKTYWARGSILRVIRNRVQMSVPKALVSRRTPLTAPVL